jgi:Asp/Glu/hydantoin racemase
MKIAMLAPIPDASPLMKFAREVYGSLSDLTILGTDTGIEVTLPQHLEYNIGPLLETAAKINKEGNCDAFIMPCFGDTGLMALRQVTSIPVLGAGETSLSMASVMGDKVGIIIPEAHVAVSTERMIKGCQLTNRIVAIQTIEAFEFLKIRTHPEWVGINIANICLQIIREHNANVLIFGALGFHSMIHQIRELVSKEGFKTPIIEPVVTTYHVARMVVELGLNQDRRMHTVGLRNVSQNGALHLF